MGFIETFGLLPAIEAADAMLKAADVTLVDKSLASGGLVTISVTGEVAAVKAAVDAAAASLGRLPGAILVSKHVIARPDDELEKIIAKKGAVKKAAAPAKAPAAAVAAKAAGPAVSAAPAEKVVKPAPAGPADKAVKPAPATTATAGPAKKASASKAKAPAPKKSKPSGKKK